MRYYLPLILLLTSLLSCSDDDPIIKRTEPDITPGTSTTGNDSEFTVQLIDAFAATALETYYLWIDDPGRIDLIESVFIDPDTCRHPKAALSRVLSKEDRWTELFENMTERLESTSGTKLSTGMDLIPYLYDQDNRRVFFVVIYVYPDSPAEQAGIKRGDIINKMDGKYFTESNYRRIYSNESSMKLSLAVKNQFGAIEDTDKVITLVPVKDYLEPVTKTEVFDIDGSKKVGYMHYTSFTNSDSTLVSSMEDFKAQGVSELILDLRYNGGGLIKTCNAFASLLAPKSATENEEVFNTNIYNKTLTEYYKLRNINLDENFNKVYAEHNPDLKKIYFLVSKYTASASEALIVGLSPYMEVSIIGEKTHGKFCSGMMIGPDFVFTEEAYNKYKDFFADWGMYLMYGTFADKNGYNRSRPNGFTPDYTIKDNPFDGYQLGDPHETMLCKALQLAGMEINADNAPTRSNPHTGLVEMEVDRPCYNIKVFPDLK